jgi:hypothetical protein
MAKMSGSALVCTVGVTTSWLMRLTSSPSRLRRNSGPLTPADHTTSSEGMNSPLARQVPRRRERQRRCRFALLSLRRPDRGIRFAMDSPLEERGFELLVPITSRRLQQFRAQAQLKLLGVAHQLLRGTAELGSPVMRQLDQPGNLGLSSRRLPMPRSSAASAHPRREGLLKFRALT